MVIAANADVHRTVGIGEGNCNQQLPDGYGLHCLHGRWNSWGCEL